MTVDCGGMFGFCGSVQFWFALFDLGCLVVIVLVLTLSFNFNFNLNYY